MAPPERIPLGERLRADPPVVGTNVVSASPAVVEALAGVGFDYVWVDLEHAGPSPYDAGAVAGLARAAALAEMALLVRVPEASRTMVNKVVDAGADAVLVPKVESAAAARRVVRAARFEHDCGPGDRGAPLARSTGWTGADEGFVRREDGAVTVGVMLETAAGVEAAEEVLAVPELGFGFVGTADLSVSLGHPLETGHPEVAAAVETLREAASDAGVPLGRVAAGPDDAAAAVNDGYRMVRLGADTAAVAETAADQLAAFEELV